MVPVSRAGSSYLAASLDGRVDCATTWFVVSSNPAITAHARLAIRSVFIRRTVLGRRMLMIEPRTTQQNKKSNRISPVALSSKTFPNYAGGGVAVWAGGGSIGRAGRSWR